MPWTSKDSERYIKGLSENQKKIWAKVANSALERCLEDDKEQEFCEGSAIRQANSVVKKATLEDELESVEYDESGNIVVTFTNKETYSTEMEVFSTGKWNKDDYSTDDLDQMVDAFECLKKKWRPYLKLGHTDKKTNYEQPALGYVDKLKRAGDKLLATVVNIPKTLKDAVEKGLYGKRSCEIFWNYADGEQKYPRVLKAIALLGSSVPAVTNLKDIEKFFDAEFIYEDEGNYDEVREYEIGEDQKNYVTKTDDGVEYPKEAYLYVPDVEKPSTWKLRIWETSDKKVTVAQLGRAAAAFSPGGFRGQKVDLPPGEIAKIKKKLISLYKSQEIEAEDIPKHLFNYNKGGINMDWEKLLEAKEEEIAELKESLKKFELEKNSSKIAELTESIEVMEKEIETLKEYKTKAEKAEKALAEKEKENANLLYKQRESEVKMYVHKMGVHGEKKILPRDESLITEILMACPEEKLFTLEGKEEKLSLADMVKEFIDRQGKKVDIGPRSSKDKEGENKEFTNVGQEVDSKTREYIAEHSGTTYYEAMKAVLAADPDLKQRYWTAKA